MSDPTLSRRFGRVFQWLAAGALALAGLFPGNNPDTLGHLAQGRQIVQLGRVPSFDTWSLLPGPRVWHNYEWLSDVVYYALYSTVGYDGLIALKCVLLVATALLLLAFARRLGGERAVVLGALALVAAIPAVRFRLSDRPHVFGLFLAAAYLALLARLLDLDETASKRTRIAHVALIGGLHVLWVNLHGSHLLGVAITGAFAVLCTRATRPYLLALLGVEAAASCISPYGPSIVIDALEHVFDSRYRTVVSEWAPWDANSPPWLHLGPALHGALLALVAPRLWRSRPSARASLGVALLLGVASFRSIRFVADFVLLSVPLVGAGYAGWLSAIEARRFRIVSAGSLGALALLVPWGASGLPPYLGLGHGLSYADLPHGPGALLARAARPPRVFGALQHSWALMWEAPNARFFVDGRVPFYGPEHVQRASDAYVDDSVFEEVLRENDINAVVLKHTLGGEQHRIASMRARGGWSLALVDDAFALYVRDDLSTASRYPRLTTLRPGYDAGWVLGATPSEQAAIRAELQETPGVASDRGYRHWVWALLALAPLARDGDRGGLRPAEGPNDWTRYRAAAGLLAATPAAARDLPTVAALEALVRATLCDFEGADEALARSTSFVTQPGRETVLAEQELALRRGQREGVRAFVEAGLAMPEGHDDPWLRGLEAELSRPPRCPR